MFRNILVAVDGSPDADQALAQAIDLAESENTRLTLMTAEPQIPTTAYLTPAISTLIADTHAEAQAVLRRARDRVPKDLPVTTIVTDQPIRSRSCAGSKRATTTSWPWARAAAAPSAPRCSEASAITS